jgi:hypothetical protein
MARYFGMDGNKKYIMIVGAVVCCLTAVCARHTGFAGEGKCNVSISEDMYETVNCRLEGDQLVWYKRDATKEIVVAGKKVAIVTFITFATEEGTYYVMLAKYATTDEDAGMKEVSFFYVDFCAKGVMYKKLLLPEECRFWLEKADTYYWITNITRAD